MIDLELSFFSTFLIVGRIDSAASVAERVSVPPLPSITSAVSSELANEASKVSPEPLPVKLLFPMVKENS